MNAAQKQATLDMLFAENADLRHRLAAAERERDTMRAVVDAARRLRTHTKRSDELSDHNEHHAADRESVIAGFATDDLDTALAALDGEAGK